MKKLVHNPQVLAGAPADADVCRLPAGVRLVFTLLEVSFSAKTGISTPRVCCLLASRFAVSYFCLCVCSGCEPLLCLFPPNALCSLLTSYICQAGMNHAAAEDIGDQSGFPPTPSSLPDAPDGPSATHEEASVTGNDPSPTSQTFPPPPVGPPVVEEQAPATPTDNYATSGSMLAVTDNSTPSTGAPNLSTAHGVSSTSSIVKFFFSPSSTMGSSPPQASASAATTTAADASANATNIAASSSAAPSSSPSTSRSIAAEDAVSSDSSPNTSSHATATDPEAALDDVSSSAAVPPTDSPKTAESSSPAVSSTTIGDRASGAKIDGEPVVAASEHAAAGKSTSGSYDQHLKSAGLNTAAAVFMPSSTHAAVQPKMQGLDIAKEAVTSGSGVSKTETRSMNALREESEAKLSASAPVFEPKSRAEVFYGSSSPRIAAGRVRPLC